MYSPLSASDLQPKEISKDIMLPVMQQVFEAEGGTHLQPMLNHSALLSLAGTGPTPTVALLFIPYGDLSMGHEVGATGPHRTLTGEDSPAHIMPQLDSEQIREMIEEVTCETGRPLLSSELQMDDYDLFFIPQWYYSYGQKDCDGVCVVLKHDWLPYNYESKNGSG